MSFWELVVIAVVALLVLGPERLPGAIRSVSGFVRSVKQFGQQMQAELAPCKDLSYVKEVRTLGAIGVVELTEAVSSSKLVPLFVEQGVWVRPFGNIIYLMPPFIITPEQLSRLTSAVLKVVATLAE